MKGKDPQKHCYVLSEIKTVILTKLEANLSEALSI